MVEKKGSCQMLRDCGKMSPGISFSISLMLTYFKSCHCRWTSWVYRMHIGWTVTSDHKTKANRITSDLYKENIIKCLCNAISIKITIT